MLQKEVQVDLGIRETLNAAIKNISSKISLMAFYFKSLVNFFMNYYCLQCHHYILG
jgi:hypothetical protein